MKNGTEAKALILFVGAAGFELATPCSQSKCSTRLSYAPTLSLPLCVPLRFHEVKGRTCALKRSRGAKQRMTHAVAGLQANPLGRAAGHLEHGRHGAFRADDAVR